ncbi:MAG: ribbon-helix-helix domain-containing protein [Candidatus Aminicenantes bacterium]|nr:ribbon-helix-helix domain-containing protein [Candidatus Aminicenantes bacterium]
MNTVSLKVPDPLAAAITETARQKGVSKSALIREALTEYLGRLETEQPGSALSRVADLLGILSGPEDLSVNKDYLEGFGR